MVTRLHATLYDSIAEHEELFEEMVLSSVTQALKDLGPQIYDLEWANSAVKLKAASEAA